MHYLLCILLLIPTLSLSAEIELREYRNSICYDGDTCYAILPSLPISLQKVSIRIRGIDTPEIRSSCLEEKILALESKAFTIASINNAKNVLFTNLEWDKYGGRILADLYLDGVLFSETIIKKNLARPYFGKKKSSWCN